ncbi:chromosome segregation ATPases-like protein [Richelia sinica FACHB-800]|uniref:Chromosome segregation ATPases-like protein n=1 Tax=Richelia sinica FACHB-800 TaxID=1357546 RepID=A0A975Y5Z4_9NOST|nr:chromosome segregation ATPase [Richelia sinica]MBD2666963.1 chromosome segregation ATPase [Richelia sinica FACHB-800]QXE24750.1 chromosome segregation ATPases-like protein [Richelia sinica FACHB-800]
MAPIEPKASEMTEQTNNTWYLVNVRSKKREVFLKYLKIAIQQNQLQELFVDVRSPQDTIYEDIVLMNLSNFRNAYLHLQKIECFQAIERKPLPSAQVNRMLGIG